MKSKEANLKSRQKKNKHVIAKEQNAWNCTVTVSEQMNIVVRTAIVLIVKM